MPINFTSILTRIKSDQRSYCISGLPEAPWYKRAFFASLCFIEIMIAEIRQNKILMRASSVTYTTTLAIIPVLVVCGSFVIWFNRSVTTSDIINYITELLGPVTNETVTGFLTESLTSALDIGLGPVGIIALLVTTVMLFITIQDSVNEIWHVKKATKLYVRILLFYALVTLGPVAVSVSLFQSTQLLNQVGVDMTLWRYMRPMLFTFLACFAAFKFLPNAKIGIKHAIIPAAVVTIIFEAFKFGFSMYMDFSFKSTNRILYGALGLIPLSLLGIYISWTILFLGVLSSYVTQNFSKLLMANFFDAQDDGHGNEWIFLGPYAPIEVLAALVRAFEQGQTPITSDKLAISCQYPTIAVDAILARLARSSFVNVIESDTELHYIIAKPLDTLRLNEIYDTFDESTPRSERYEKLNSLIRNETEHRHNHFDALTADTLREKTTSPARDHAPEPQDAAHNLPD